LVVSQKSGKIYNLVQKSSRRLQGYTHVIQELKV
jgi:hypothetical protein